MVEFCSWKEMGTFIIILLRLTNLLVVNDPVHTNNTGNCGLSSALLLINRDSLINNFRKGILIYSLVISIVALCHQLVTQLNNNTYNINLNSLYFWCIDDVFLPYFSECFVAEPWQLFSLLVYHFWEDGHQLRHQIRVSKLQDVTGKGGPAGVY